MEITKEMEMDNDTGKLIEAAGRFHSAMVTKLLRNGVVGIMRTATLKGYEWDPGTGGREARGGLKLVSP